MEKRIVSGCAVIQELTASREKNRSLRRAWLVKTEPSQKRTSGSRRIAAHQRSSWKPTLVRLKQAGNSILPATGTAEVVSHHLLGYRLPKLTSDLQRMMIVKASIDASPEYFIQKAASILKIVFVHAVSKCFAIRLHMHTSASEEIGNHSRNRYRLRSRGPRDTRDELA